MHSRTHIATRWILTSLVVLAPELMAPRSVAAQANTVSLAGTVTSVDGSAVRAARVEVRRHDTDVTRVARTDSAGAYRMLALVPGTYDITVRAVGFSPQRREDRLILGQRAEFDFVLRRGAVELEPTVVVARHRLEVHRADVSTVVLQEDIENLPLNTRNVLNLSAIAPGVRTFALEGGRSVPASGALPVAEPRFGNLYVDGVEWKGMYIGAIVGVPADGSMIPQEAVREFRVYLNAYDAEYSHGASHVFSAVTHQGTNTREGALFAFYQNRDLVARGSFQSEKPAYARYQVGGNLRGPIVKDHLFYSLSYEGQVTDNYIDVVPGRPAENPAQWNAYAGTFKAPHQLHNAFLRLTASVGTHALDASWATRHLRRETGFGVSLQNRMLSHAAGITGGSAVNIVQLRDTWARPSLVNELALEFVDLRNHQTAIISGPTFQYPGVHIGRSNYPFDINDRQVRLIDKLSFTRDGLLGTHLLRSGVEVGALRDKLLRPNNSGGVFVFSQDTATWPIRATIGMGLNDPTSTRDARVTMRGWAVGAYLQDEWHPVAHLAITLGLRYDADINTLNQNVLTPWRNDAALTGAFGEGYLNTGDRENDLDNVAPRAALSWDLLRDGSTFIRGGYGVMYDRVPVFQSLAEARDVNWKSYTFTNPGTTDPAELRQRVAGGSQGNVPSNVTLLKDHLSTPANHQWSVGIGRRLDASLALNLDYTHNRVKNAYTSVVVNRPVGGVRPVAGFGDVTLWGDFGDAAFDAVLGTLTYARQRTHATLAYTRGWARSEFGEFTTSDYPDSSAYVMQPSEGDERHRFVLSGWHRLPWSLDASTLAIVASPRPFLVGTGVDDNLNGSSLDDWPNGVRTARRREWSHWYRAVDVRLARTFGSPRRRVTALFEVFNVLNTANHAEYQSLGNQLAFGDPVGDFARRQAQIGMRYTF
jgi:hypothetical protein